MIELNDTRLNDSTWSQDYLFALTGNVISFEKGEKWNKMITNYWTNWWDNYGLTINEIKDYWIEELRDFFDPLKQPPFVGPPTRPQHAQQQASPIILDLDGDGVETTSISDGVYFDHDNNLFAEKTAWVGPDDALLVLDNDQNGKIDGGSELFGNNFMLKNGDYAKNGFEALAEFDTNGDGIVNNNDERWAELKLWP